MLLASLDITSECRALNLGLGRCPPFLFLLMGFSTIVSMVATYLIANRYFVEPEIGALAVSFSAALFFVIGNLIIKGFNAVVDANRSKTEFVSIISHQLGAPLSIFRMTLGLMQRQLKNGAGEEAGSHLETLTYITDRMIGLVNSLLEVSRIESSRLALRVEPVALEILTQRLIEGFRRYADAHKVVLILHAERGLPTVAADRDKIEMVVQNLIDNAIRYTAGGGEVTVGLSVEDGMVRCGVRDSGAGIPPDEQRYIFQKFFRGSSANHRDAHGSGIGLYIAKAIIDASGGKIGFTSEEGKGSTFWFTLPVYASNKQIITANKNE